jgi:hypothetical protein
MGWVQITNTKTGRVLVDTRVDVVHITERDLITDSNGKPSYSGPVIESNEYFTINDSSRLSDWLKTKEAHMFGFHKTAKNKDCKECNKA